MPEKILCGTVVKGVGGVFTVVSDKGKYVCFAPKKIRYNDADIVVGDKVTFLPLHGNKGNIVDVLPRKNKLTRPEVANVDVCFVVVSPVPQPDFLLADKVLVNCFVNDILPVLVVNKTDLDDGKLFAKVQNDYGKVCDIVAVCAKNNDVQSLKNYINNKVVCFAGQSAVGKTSLLNALCPSLQEKIGGLSQKSGRGTHTTRHASLHSMCDGYVVDTCGFSLCDIDGVRSDQLRLYFDDFVEIGHNCKFTGCTHTVEPNCAVKQAVEDGQISRERYQRYVDEYNELVEAEKRQY